MARKRKTNKSAAKRFKITKSGKVKKAKCFRGHLLTLKSSKRKRKLGGASYCFASDAKNIKKLLPYS
jgi:large subunit ribosomal protein L35